MLGYEHFHHSIIRKIVVVFGRIFEGLKIERADNDGNVIQIIDVPISYGPKEKWLARLQEKPDITKKTAITLPRMGFEMVAMQYDPSRKIQTMNRIKANNMTATKETDEMYAPVPYNLTFNLYIVTKTIGDALQIVEQIVPFFTPQFTTTINIVQELEISQDIPITLVGTSFTDSYEGSFEQRREIIHTLTFDIKCNLYGPVTRAGTILETIMNIDPKYGTIARRATSTASQDINGIWNVEDAIYDIERDPAIY